MTTDITLRLLGAATAEGEIAFEDISAIAKALQELALRVTRTCVPSHTTGRPTELVSELSRLRLRGIRSGSTVLLAARGRHEVLDLPHSLDDLVDERLSEVVAGLAASRRPQWADRAVASSVLDFARALRHAAPRSEFTVGPRAPIALDTRDLRVEVWTPDAAIAFDPVSVSGKLEAVDLRQNRFRIVDDLTHRFRLEDVKDAEAVAPLVGSRVLAEGIGGLDESGTLRVLHSATVTAAPLPPAWLTRGEQDLERELAKPGPALDGGPELDDEEFTALLAYIQS
ncbi:hypothetical protein ACTXMW_01815 [Brachybacterium paraconglomeratum]|uniref:hypothetical protein n=1 Tax=Brachybacterium paraconglomeratum TaxID=173362 RepID=UPI003FD272FE